jgi:putative PIN family toxin of toxin-antitoxin system
MIKTVIDTNIIISALLSGNSTPAKALDYALDHNDILISNDTFLELSEKLLNKKFDKYLLLETRKLFLDRFNEIAKTVNIERKLAVCRDSKDDKFLELAVNGQADCILTGDKDLLVLHPFEGVDIVTARDFLQRSTS